MVDAGFLRAASTYRKDGSTDLLFWPSLFEKYENEKKCILPIAGGRKPQNIEDPSLVIMVTYCCP